MGTGLACRARSGLALGQRLSTAATVRQTRHSPTITWYGPSGARGEPGALLTADNAKSGRRITHALPEPCVATRQAHRAP